MSENIFRDKKKIIFSQHTCASSEKISQHPEKSVPSYKTCIDIRAHTRKVRVSPRVLTGMITHTSRILGCMTRSRRHL